MATKSATGGSYNRKRVWLGGGLVLVIAILAIGWFVVIGPVLTETDATRNQIESVELQNTILETKNAKLKAENDDVGTVRDNLAAGLAEVPADSGLPSFTRQLSAQAAAHDVVVTSVIVGATTEVAATAAAAAPAAVDPATAPAADVAVATTATSGLSQVTITVAATGTGADLGAFLGDIQVAGPRRALVSSVATDPSDPVLGVAPDTVSRVTLTMSVFSTPVSADEQATLEKLLNGS